MMKVLHYISSTGMGRGEVYIDLVNVMCKYVDVVLLVPKDNFYRDRVDSDVEIVEYTSYDSRISPILLIEIIFKIRSIKPDIVHTHFSKATQIFYGINKILHIPHVATKHNPRKGKIFHKIKNVTAVSKNVAESISSENVKIIYNGIKPFDLEPSKEKNNVFSLLAVGRLDKIKGFDILIKECSQLKFPFLLQIVGEGEERKNLEILIEELNLSDKIKLLGFRKDIPKLMNSADVVVMSSYSEGFSLVMVESLFYANLFISTKVSGATEILDDRFLFDIKDMGSKIEDIYQNYDIYKKLFKNLQDKVKKKLLLSNIVLEYIDLYQKILEEKK